MDLAAPQAVLVNLLDTVWGSTVQDKLKLSVVSLITPLPSHHLPSEKVSFFKSAASETAAKSKPRVASQSSSSFVVHLLTKKLLYDIM